MDLRPLNLNNCNRGSVCPKLCSFSQETSWPRTSFSCNFPRLCSLRSENGSFLEIKVLKSKLFTSLVVRAMEEKNLDNSSFSGNNHASYNNNFDLSDWRNFRANFVAQEVKVVDIDAPCHDDASHLTSKPLGLKWAHPISGPENGCVLVATDKLDGVRAFERTVILLLKSGNKDPRKLTSIKAGLPIPKIWEDSIGVVINRPLHKKIDHMKPSNLDLATTFADCSLYFGGPLEASTFLLNTEDNSLLPGFEQVISGLHFGGENSFDEAAALVKKGILRPQDFRFFVGYVEWTLDQLKKEIEADYWYAAACSANLMCGNLPDFSSEGLWEEILQLMGRQYAELSRKPKQDS